MEEKTMNQVIRGLTPYFGTRTVDTMGEICRRMAHIRAEEAFKGELSEVPPILSNKMETLVQELMVTDLSFREAIQRHAILLGDYLISSLNARPRNNLMNEFFEALDVFITDAVRSPLDKGQMLDMLKTLLSTYERVARNEDSRFNKGKSKDL